VRPVEIGIGPWTTGFGSRTDAGIGFLRQAELAEALGFHSIWLPESHFEPAGACPSPLLLLAAAAARTSRLRLGTTSYLLSVRHPVHVAEEVAVLDRLSGGRVLLGVGRGFRRSLFSTFGVSAAEKRDRFESTLETVLRAWRGESLGTPRPDTGSEKGTPVRVSPEPVQKPHPPVWVAAFGPKALEQAGRLGLPYLASPMEPIDRLVENYQRHRAALREPKQDCLAVPVIRTLFVSRNRERICAVREALSEQARAVVDRLGERFSRLADATVDDWALVGNPEEVTEAVQRYRERIGLSHLIARAQVPGADQVEIEDSIRLLAEHVRPRL
jgi:alkanesulfonate monooxygenase SsuD/methylene tetrahydromethanopterin reductase-like flavin-dependent oxidoreductase (luciferase family)